ncbi:hypothetical protein ACQ5SO_14055 [Rhodovulum sp. DZ06]|uniref:hypothetical protein n=1 Tax=Rhodovulum sp. DZ06 TaxID=3425126 RepID=UPI003D33F73A
MSGFPHPRREPGDYPRSAPALQDALIARAVSVAGRRGVRLRGEAAQEVRRAAGSAACLLAARIDRGGRFSAGSAVAVDRAIRGMGAAVQEALRGPGRAAGDAGNGPVEAAATDVGGAMAAALDAWVLAPLRPGAPRA